MRSYGFSDFNSESASTQMESDLEILTIKEVSDLLRVHPGTIYRLSREGKIPGFRIGGIWRFRRDLIVRWMAEQTQPID